MFSFRRKKKNSILIAFGSLIIFSKWLKCAHKNHRKLVWIPFHLLYNKKEIIQKKGIKGRPDYLSYNKKNYSIPNEFEGKEISLEISLKIINDGSKSVKRKK